MNAETFLAWKSLYLQVFLCSLTCAIVTAIFIGWQIAYGQWRPPVATGYYKLLYLPKIWWRWRILYFSGVPAIALITILYTFHLGLDVLGNV